MYIDTAIRETYFLPLQEQAIDLTLQVQESGAARHIKLSPIISAIEQATAVGLDLDGVVRLSDAQMASSAPVVLCARALESPLKFELNEWREAGLFKTPKMAILGKIATRAGIVKESNEDIDPTTHSKSLHGFLYVTEVPRVITLPAGQSTNTHNSLPHEVVHWVDKSKTHFRVAGKKSWPKERMLMSTHTEKRAYSLEAAILGLSGIDIESLSDKVIAKVKDINEVSRISDICYDVAAESVSRKNVASTGLCLEARTATKLFGNGRGQPTLHEARAYRELDLINN